MNAVLFILVILNIRFKDSLAYSSGAPNTGSVCRQQLPQHRIATSLVVAQDTRAPFTLSTNTTKADVGDVIEVKIEANENAFKGFLLTVLTKQNTAVSSLQSIPVGRFIQNEDVKPLSCTGENDTATHTGSGLKHILKASFKVSNSVHKVFHVGATVVQNYRTYWTKILSPEIKIFADNTGKQDIAVKWLLNVTDVAKSIQVGNEEWERQIESRFSSGFDGILNEKNIVSSGFIIKNLPFTFSEKSGIHKHNGDPSSVNEESRDVIEKLLSGDVQYADEVKHFIDTK